MNNRRRAISLVILFALSAVACASFDGLLGGGDGAADTTAPDASGNSESEADSDARFFVEDFEGDLRGWHDEVLGEGGQAHTSIIDGSFVFELLTEFTYAYTFYDEATYDDVRLTAEVENQGNSDNYFTLICRATDAGWYEFNVASDGPWSILSYSSDSGDYAFLAEGTSEHINLDLAGNQFTAICDGDQLTLLINGESISTVTDSTYTEGQIGISVASFGALPVKVAFDRLEVSQP